jgi:hypothetical protein
MTQLIVHSDGGLYMEYALSHFDIEMPRILISFFEQLAKMQNEN